MVKLARKNTTAVMALLVVIVVFAFPSLANASTASYNQTIIGPFHRIGPYTVAINGLGDVTGEGKGNGLFLFTKKLHNLGKPTTSKWAVGMGVSNDDVIAATAEPASGRRGYAVSYANGKESWSALLGVGGLNLTQATGILPDSSMIVGDVCSTASNSCASSVHPAEAAVWKRSGGRYGVAQQLPAGNSSGSDASGIARDNSIIAIAGTITQSGATHPVVWTFQGKSPLHLALSKTFQSGTPYAIAHGLGSTFYVSGTLSQTNTSVTEAVLWTLSCTPTQCTQTAMHVLTQLGEAYGVNSQGNVLGYDRTAGNGGFQFLWKSGRENQLALGGFVLNNSGQIAGWAQQSKPTRIVAYLLTPIAKSKALPTNH